MREVIYLKNAVYPLNIMYNTHMDSKEFDGIIFDIDGTIWDTTGIVARAWNRAIEMSGFDAARVTSAVLKKEFGKTMETIARDLWPRLTDGERGELMGLCCAEEQKAVRDNDENITFPHVLDTIKTLSTYQNLYIVSNCQKGYIELTMQKTGLTPYIKDFECYGRTLKGKAENIQILMSRNRLRNPVYVGDTQGDAEECLQARVPFIWAAYGFGTAENYIEKLDSFSDLLKIFEP